MEDVIRIRNQFYILATSPLADGRTRVLKDGETFAVFDRYGDIQPTGLGEQGLYHEGTRFLSRLEVRLDGQHPLLLSSMDWHQIEGKWRQIKGKVREQWGKFTDDDLDFIGGKREQFLGRLQERYGLDRAEAERRLEEWQKTVKF